MTDAELTADFMRTRCVADATILQVATVTWSGPCSPGLRWHNFRTWSSTPDLEEVAAAQTEALASPSYFQRCDRCSERHNIGHMHDDHMCQGCAARDLGVVY
jgi:hypothetical protein